MLIVGNDIIENQVLENANPKHIRSASYYLRIHSIIPAGEDAKNYDISKPIRNYTIRPGGLAWIVSKERFIIKNPGITALVTLRSSFTKRGLLALDVGLVDANYEGPIGSIVINFSKNDISLREGLEFFRVIFIRHEQLPPDKQAEKQSFSHTEYIGERLDNLIGDFPSTFLQTHEIEDRIKENFSNEGIIDRLEQNLLDMIAQRVVKKYFWYIIISFILIVVGLTVVSIYIFTSLFPHASIYEVMRIMEIMNDNSANSPPTQNE